MSRLPSTQPDGAINSFRAPRYSRDSAHRSTKEIENSAVII